MEDENLIPKEWVYMGQRIRQGKRVYVWGPLGDDRVVYYPKPLISASVGAVYIVYESADGKTFRKSGLYGPRYSRRHDQEDEILIWAAMDEEAKQELAVKAMNTKAAKVEPLDGVLLSIRRIAVNLNRVERRALLSRIADELFTVK